MANGTYSNQCPVPCPHLPLHFASDFLAWDSEALLAASVYPAYILISHPSHPTSALADFNSFQLKMGTGSNRKQMETVLLWWVLQYLAIITIPEISSSIFIQALLFRVSLGGTFPSILMWRSNQPTNTQTDRKKTNEWIEWMANALQLECHTYSIIH